MGFASMCTTTPVRLVPKGVPWDIIKHGPNCAMSLPLQVCPVLSGEPGWCLPFSVAMAPCWWRASPSGSTTCSGTVSDAATVGAASSPPATTPDTEVCTQSWLPDTRMPPTCSCTWLRSPINRCSQCLGGSPAWALAGGSAATAPMISPRRVLQEADDQLRKLLEGLGKAP